MSVPIDNIINVSIGIAPTATPLPGFGNLLFLSDEAKAHVDVDETNRVQTFGSLTEVSTMYPIGTYPKINSAAATYYSQNPTPVTFMVGAVLASPTAGFAKSNEHSTLDVFQAITAGGFSIEVDGAAAAAITPLDFSSVTSLLQVAQTINAGLVSDAVGATCVYLDGDFVFTSDTTGATSAVLALSVDVGGLAAALGMLTTSDPAPTVVAGLAVESALVGLSECAIFDNTFNEVIIDEIWNDTSSAIDVSDYCQATKRIFGNTTNDANVLALATAPTTIAGQIDAKSNGNTITTYTGITTEYASASVLARINSVNYQGTDTTITLMFKKLPTITVSKLTTTQKKALESINANSFLKVGSTSLYSDGRMAGGGWLDTVHGVSWLEKQVQNNVFNLGLRNDIISYTESGVAQAVQQVDLALSQAVRNGLVAAGNDAEGNYLPAGYEIITVPVVDVSASDKSTRQYNGISFKAVGAGALHGFTITGTFSE